jgi:outer membrane biosynthesis protein TonB
MRRMDDPDRLEAKGLARAKIRAKRRRAYSIRRRTVRGSLALFALVWAILFAQLVSGNDPALSRIPKAHRRAVAAATPQPAREPETETEAEAEAALEAERLPEEEFVEEPEVEAVPVEEAPAEIEPEAEVAPEPAPEPEPEPIITSSS